MINFQHVKETIGPLSNSFITFKSYKRSIWALWRRNSTTRRSCALPYSARYKRQMATNRQIFSENRTQILRSGFREYLIQSEINLTACVSSRSRWSGSILNIILHAGIFGTKGGRLTLREQNVKSCSRCQGPKISPSERSGMGPLFPKEYLIKISREFARRARNQAHHQVKMYGDDMNEDLLPLSKLSRTDHEQTLPLIIISQSFQYGEPRSKCDFRDFQTS